MILSRHKRIGTTDKALFKSKCVTISQDVCNISDVSRPLRCDEFTMKLAEGEIYL